MWKLITAEWRYNKTLLILLYLFVLPFFIVNALRDGFEEHLARAIWITVPVLAIAMNNDEKKLKKNPMYAKLPITPAGIGITRLSIWVPFWLSLVILFGISSLIGTHITLYTNLLWIFLTLASSMIIIGGFSSTILDLRYCIRGKAQNHTLMASAIIIIWVLAMIYFFMSVSESLGPYLARIFFTPIASIIMATLAILLLISSVTVYSCRKSYLE